MIFGEPEASRFIVALQRLKLEKQRREKLAKTAKLKVRAAVRKGREC